MLKDDKKPDLNDLIGKKFKRGARGPEAYDCHGLAIETFKRYGIPFPDIDIAGMSAELVTSKLNEEISKHVCIIKDWEEIQTPVVPCLVVLRGDFEFSNHLGVYIGDGKIIHAREMTRNFGHVTVDRLSGPINWKNRVGGYYKYVGD